MIDAWFERFTVSINLNIFYVNLISLLLINENFLLQILTPRKILNGIELTMLLQGGAKRITLQLGNIGIKIIKNLILLFSFIFHLLIDNSFVPYRLRGFWYKAQKKAKKYAKKKRF